MAIEVKNTVQVIKLQKGKKLRERHLEAFMEEETSFGPMLSLDNGVDNEWSFGVVKARKIVEAYAAIKEFVEATKDYVPATTKKGKVEEVQLTEAEKQAHKKALLAQLAAYSK